jgi:DNA phosphorothioation-associated putative methyltransferase
VFEETVPPGGLGKTVSRRTYVHVLALAFRDDATALALSRAEDAAGLRRSEHYNVVRFERDGRCVALLDYPAFFDDPFPSLKASWRVDLETGEVGHRTYADSLNPPILHRKELLLPEDHPRRAEYAALTESCEVVGLFDHPTRIGYRRQWEQLVRDKGYRVVGHQLVPIGNAEGGEPAEDEEPGPLHAGWQAARHLTALTRYAFSAPVQTLARYGFLDGSLRVFDYGCGRGDDLRGLHENGIEAGGWDPYFAPENPISSADIVNLGFVVNVIEDFDERLDALTRAWSLAERLLVVSVMLANQNDVAGQRFRDGVLTRRGTFQKYYTQAEIKAFLEAALDEEPIPVAPGVLYVFRDKEAEQRFLVDRYRSRRNLLRGPSLAERPRPVRERAVPRPRRDRAEERYQSLREPLDRLWERWVALGRTPEAAEVDDLPALLGEFGTLGRALRFMAGRRDIAEVEQSATRRIADLEVYFALNQFERRRPYRHLERGLKLDIKAFFGDYGAAEATSRALLFQIADVDAIEAACRHAGEHGLGWLEIEDVAARAPLRQEAVGSRGALTLHTSLVEQLPPLLRVYVGCAAVLYGDYRNADLVKVHIGSGKLSLMRYDDFAGTASPAHGRAGEDQAAGAGHRVLRLRGRVRAALSLSQVAVHQRGVSELSGAGRLRGGARRARAVRSLRLRAQAGQPFLERLAASRWTIDGFDLARSTEPPALDDPCGRYLTFRQLIECGETQARTGMANLPRQAGDLERAAGPGRAGAGPGDRLLRDDPADLRLLLAGACPRDPRPDRPEAGPARRLRAQSPRQPGL